MDTPEKIITWLLLLLLGCTTITVCQNIKPCTEKCKCCLNNDCDLHGGCKQGCNYQYPGCRVISVVDGSCGESDCKCCATNQCSSGGHCTDGCKPGYHGGRCKNKCPNNCITCTDHPDAGQDRPDLWSIGYCTTCEEGHYFTDDLYQCQSSCSSGCKACISGSNCISCQTGYFPDIQNPGSCIVCPNECSSCNEYTGCSSCETGYFHTLSDGPGRCLQCPDNCISCESNDTCILCNNVHYGTICDLKCSTGCLTPCLKESGTCKCKQNFVGDKCNSCVTGNFGDNCAKVCPQNCQNNECNRLSGNCNACIGNHVLPKCEICTNGFYGLDCENKCPNNCMNKTCYQFTGNCSLGCRGNFTGDSCEQCIIGKFGNECENDCPKMCLNNICDMMTGHCRNCLSNFTGNTCEDCIIGVYGPDCKLSCPPNCQDSVCYRKDGTCKNGCAHGYSGNMCCLNSSFCDTCSSFYECDRCLDGKFGQTCENNCSLNCKQPCNKNNGSCNGCKDGFQGQNCEDPVFQPRHQDGNSIAVPIAWSLCSLAIVSLIVLIAVFIYKRRLSGKNSNSPRLETEEIVYENEGITVHHPNQATETYNCQSLKAELSSPSVETKPSENLDGADYYNTLNQKVQVSRLADYVKGQTRELFIKEFQNLPKGLLKPCIDAKKPQNLVKNRYNSIYPYDDDRVRLAPPGSDFINACFINGYNKKREYIASLGPILKATEEFKTFWRMVWQEKTEKIVMVTNLMERSGMKCEKYWPDVCATKAYGDVIVTCQSEEIFAEYALRKLTVFKGDEKRPLYQVHYTAWPDKTVPVDITSLIDFRQKVNMIKTTSDGPTIVHCSAGVGRTGTYIALDILTQEGETEGTVDVFGCVSRLRHQRTSMVQTWGQYEYLHHALVHTLTFDYRPIAAQEFEEFVSTCSDAVMVAKFERLHSATENVPESEVKAKQRNINLRHLNRKDADIPGDIGRPRLYEDKTEGENDYINAVYLNSYRQKDRYILAMTPLPETVTDFLTLLIQEKVSCVVALDDQHSQVQVAGTYIPADNQTMNIGYFEVKSDRVTSNSCYVQRSLTCTLHTRSGPKSQMVHHFQINHWPGGAAVPHDDAKFLKLIREAEKAADDTSEKATMVVHCLNAAERSCLFCALSIMLQKMDTEREVSVINTLRQVKVRRSLAIPNKEQYAFCHECICTHLQSVDSNVYTNLATGQ